MSVTCVPVVGQCCLCGKYFHEAPKTVLVFDGKNLSPTYTAEEEPRRACEHDHGYVINECCTTQKLVCGHCFKTKTMDELVAIEPAMDDNARFRMAEFKAIRSDGFNLKDYAFSTGLSTQWNEMVAREKAEHRAYIKQRMQSMITTIWHIAKHLPKILFWLAFIFFVFLLWRG